MPSSSTARPVFRFAPTPNGPLHLGHARSALLNHDAARESGGRFLLRIENIDPTRCRPEFEAAILDDLAWLGLDWETPVRRQSEQMDDYRAALARLEGMGLVYRSFESRADIRRAVEARPSWPTDPDGAPVFPFPRDGMGEGERARRSDAGEPYALRLDMAAAMARVAMERVGGPLSWVEEGEGRIAADPAAWGDVVIARKEVPTSYHLAVVVDDAAQGVTHVIRGADLKPSTSVHRLLQHLLGLPEPAYRHHALVLDEEGGKLSKSLGSAGLRTLGASPEEVQRMALDGLSIR